MPADTIPQILLQAAHTFDKPDAFRIKKAGRYIDISHRDVLKKVLSAAAGLRTLGFGKNDHIALLSENRIEWPIADLAILTIGGVNVPIHTTLPPGQVEYILKDSEAKAIFVSDGVQLDKILSIKHSLPALQHIIAFDPMSRPQATLTLDELYEKGDSKQNAHTLEAMIDSLDGRDRASIIYTSGTTGHPKGVVLTHANITSNVKACGKAISLSTQDTCLSNLPLSHIFERTAGYYVMLDRGVTIALAESIDTILQNLSEVRPTVLLSVPRFFEKTYARIMEAATSGSLLKKYAFFWALEVGKRHTALKLSGRMTSAMRIKYRVAAHLVFAKLKRATGGRIRFFVSGGAALMRELNEFFSAAGLPILEGYGMTEASPVVAVNTFTAFRFGTVGRPLHGVEVKIAEDGEILVRGPNVMDGYYRRPDLTEEALDGEWLRTGDIGHLDEEGYLTITDRKKDLIITAGGKNIAPQPIENRLKTNKYVAQAVLIGNGRKFISALIVPNFQNLIKFAKAEELPYVDIPSLLKHPRIIEKMAHEIERMSSDLASFEKVKKFILLEKDFSMNDGELTPTLKVKRRVVEEKFRETIDRMYEE